MYNINTVLPISINKNAEVKNPKPNIKLLALTLSLFLLATFSYYTFTTFIPKVLLEIQEVKGLSRKNSQAMLPWPLKAQIIAINDSKLAQSITLKSTESQDKVHDFYKTVLYNREYDLENTGQHEIFKSTTYKKGTEKVTITTSQDFDDETITVVTIEILKRY